jgi:hypothetical protein
VSPDTSSSGGGFGSRLGWREILLITAAGGAAQVLIALLLTDPAQLVLQIAAVAPVFVALRWLIEKEKRR